MWFGVRDQGLRLESGLRQEMDGLRREIRGLEREIARRAVEARDSGVAGRVEDLEARVERLEEGLETGIRLLEEEATQVDLVLEWLRSGIRSGASLLDESPEAREAIGKLLDRELESRREEFMKELRGLNRDLRRRWISQVSGELGLSDPQRIALQELYDRQSDAWAELYHAAQTGGMEPGTLLEEMNRVRSETDVALTNILGLDLKDEFRRAEERIFGDANRATPRGETWRNEERQ